MWKFQWRNSYATRNLPAKFCEAQQDNNQPEDYSTDGSDNIAQAYINHTADIELFPT